MRKNGYRNRGINQIRRQLQVGQYPEWRVLFLRNELAALPAHLHHQCHLY